MNLYLRLLWTWLRARFMAPIRLGDTIELTLRVWPSDLDVNGHMNNGRYMTITDLAFVEYFTRAGLLGAALRQGWRPMLGGTLISYRRGLKPLRRYTLRFSLVCWDKRWNYLQFRFVRGGKTMALGQAKGALVGAGGALPGPQARAALGLQAESPAFPPEVLAWIRAERLMASA